jgi:hypothetical protein
MSSSLTPWPTRKRLWAASTAGRVWPAGSGELECDCERLVEVAKPRCGQAADIVREGSLGETHQLIAMDRALMLQALGRSYGDLRREAVARGVDRSASHSREGRVEESRSADDYEDAGALRIALRMSDSIELAAFHQSA